MHIVLFVVILVVFILIVRSEMRRRSRRKEIASAKAGASEHPNSASKPHKQPIRVRVPKGG
jgi:flagellar biosynthesis/type III secretory pathway M-ring protein FliF/YscJ